MFSENFRVIFLIYFCVFFVLKHVTANAEEIKSPVSSFSKHSIVQPIVHHGRTKREISTTRDVSGVHHPVVTITMVIDGEEYILDLRLNQDLIAENHVLSYQDNGNTVVQKPKAEDLDLCHYRGTVRDRPGSWAAVSTCHGLQGAVFDGHTVRYIEPAHGELTGKHYVFDHLDLSDSFQREAFKHFRHKSMSNIIEKKQQTNNLSRNKREISYDPKSHGPYIENEESRYVELAFVLDHSQYKANGGDLRRVYHNMQIYANILNSVYTPLNIFIILVGVEVWNDRNRITLHDQANETLYNFNEYRKKHLVDRIPHDNAHFLTGRQFENNVVGLAYVGTMCTYSFSTGLTYNHTDKIGLLAMTTAHEMGHNFGMNHDPLSCSGADYIMKSQSGGRTPTNWSPCSLKSIRSTFRDGLDYCLRNKPKHLEHSICDFSRGRQKNCVKLSDRSSMCGNGFVDPGEQCDCGTLRDPHTHDPCHSCCDPKTCTLRANATCGAGQCCDLQTCRPKSAGTVCRSAKRDCDLPEYCTGESENCPDNVHKMDATPCGKGEQSAYCVSGNCRSHIDQCRLLYGSTSRSAPDLCYEDNVDGLSYGNCGYDVKRDIYKKCQFEDTMCGRLHCTRRNAQLQYGNFGSPSESTRIVTINRRTFWCSSVRIDVGLRDVDPGLVPDGAKCGHDKMCLNQKCVSVSETREQIAKSVSSVCPASCGHGVCNSKGQCHCDPGFAPPHCQSPGAGGSIDSGPASNLPYSLETFKVVMYAIFLGILPLTVLIVLLIYYIRHNGFSKSNDFIRQLLRLECINTGNLDSRNVPDRPNIQVNLSNSNRESDTIYAYIDIINKNDAHAPVANSDKNNSNISSFPNKYIEKTTHNSARSDKNYVNMVSPTPMKPIQDTEEIYANVPIDNTKRPIDNLTSLPKHIITKGNTNSPGIQLPGKAVNISNKNLMQTSNSNTRPENTLEQSARANSDKFTEVTKYVNLGQKPIDVPLPVNPLVANISNVNLKKTPNNTNLPNNNSQATKEDSNFLGVRLKKVNKDIDNPTQESGNINYKNVLKPTQGKVNLTNQFLHKVDNVPGGNLSSTTPDNVTNSPFKKLNTRDGICTNNNDNNPKRTLNHNEDYVNLATKSMLTSPNNVPNTSNSNKKKMIPPKPSRKINDLKNNK